MKSSDALTPIDLRDFLKSQGWVLVPAALDRRLFAFNHSQHPRRQLMLPMDMTVADYAEAVDVLLEKFCSITGAERLSVLAKIETIRDDVLCIRVFNDKEADDVPLGFASSLISSSQKLLKAAACSVLRPRAHHPRLFSSETCQLIDQSRFGQTQRGSFVLRIACPLQALQAQANLQLDSADAPFVRHVTLLLNQALRQLAAAIEADSVDELVTSVMQSEVPLVSSNLCEALSGMYDQTLSNSLDLGIDWSPARELPPGTQTGPIRVQRDYFQRIDDVRRELRAAEREHEDEFIGTVERLDGEMGVDGVRSGEVVLAILLAEGETVRARMVLTPEQYAIANHAHMTEGVYVSVTGRLRPGNQPRALTEITDFRVVNRR